MDEDKPLPADQELVYLVEDTRGRRAHERLVVAYGVVLYGEDVEDVRRDRRVAGPGRRGKLEVIRVRHYDLDRFVLVSTENILDATDEGRFGLMTFRNKPYGAASVDELLMDVLQKCSFRYTSSMIGYMLLRPFQEVGK